MSHYILIEQPTGDHLAYQVDTPEQIAEARAALAGAGLSRAAIYAGDPDCPDSYATGGVLWADQPGTSPFALLDDACETIIRTYEHTEAERDDYARRYGRRYVYLPLGGEPGDRVAVDDDGEATVIGGAR